MVPLTQPGQPSPERGEPPGHVVGTPDEQATGVVQATALGQQFEVLYSTYYARIRAYLFHLLGDREQAEDAAQETFLKAWRHLGGLRPNSRVSSWLYRIARNTALDVLRRRALITWQSLQGLDEEDNEQEQAYSLHEVALLLQRAFDLLPPRHKRVLALWKGERPVAQMAAILETTEVAAKGRLSRARNAWRHCYAALSPDSQP